MGTDRRYSFGADFQFRESDKPYQRVLRFLLIVLVTAFVVTVVLYSVFALAVNTDNRLNSVIGSACNAQHCVPCSEKSEKTDSERMRSAGKIVPENCILSAENIGKPEFMHLLETGLVELSKNYF
jgi:hypothetical protein